VKFPECVLLILRPEAGLIVVVSLALLAAEPPPDTLAWLVTWEGAFADTLTVTVIGG